MIKDVHFVSQYHAERIDGRPDVIVISIQDPNSRPNLRSGFRDVLCLAFDDYDRERDGVDALKVGFTAEQAETLKDWLEPYLRAGVTYTLLVHCHAGISRSAAVAWWAHKALGLELKTEYPAWHLNRHVLRALDPDVSPPQRPADVSGMPQERSFGPPPILGPIPPRQTLVVFAHGKESGPWGTKIRYLARIAQGHGAEVLSLDYQDLMDPELRVARLLDYALPKHDDLILVGSSLGGYVSAVASQTLKPHGLFLMAPAVGMPGYGADAQVPTATRTCIVHGWEDEVIPVEPVLNFARATGAEMHLIRADHRLTASLPTVGLLFENFLSWVTSR